MPLTEAGALAVVTDENDPRRFSYHRALANCAREGDTQGAERALAQLTEAGLVPGPRAYHGLAFAHVKAAHPRGALEVAQRAAAQGGVTLLPETYVLLVLAFMEQDPPDVTTAEDLMFSMKHSGADVTPAWRIMAKLLFQKEMRVEAAALVQQGMADGLVPDTRLCEMLCTHLCDSNQLDDALVLVEETLPQLGIDRLPKHCNPLVKALALRGEIGEAEQVIDGMMANVGADKGHGPNVGSYNALLEGVVKHIRPGDESLLNKFQDMRQLILQNGLRPNRYTFKLLCEGYVKMREADLALGAFDNMRKTAGVAGSRLLDAVYLSSFLILLAEEDRPVDLQHVLEDMIEDSCPIPWQAMTPLTEDGKTIVSSWIRNHLDHMFTLSPTFTMQVASERAKSSSIRLVDDVRIGMGGCVVDEFGEIQALGKLSLKELRAEASHRGIDAAQKRPDLVRQLKGFRDNLQQYVLAEQRKLQEARRARVRAQAAPGSVAQDNSKAPPKKKGRVVTQRAQFMSFRDGKLVDQREIEYEVPKAVYIRTRNEGSGDDDRGDADDPSDLSTTLALGVGEEVQEIIESDDTYFDDSVDMTKSEDTYDSDKDDKDEFVDTEAVEPQVVMEHYDAKRSNTTAGMDVAMGVVRAVETLGGRLSGGDVRMLAAGARTEQNAASAVEVVRLCQAVGELQRAPSEQLALATDMAQLCLSTGRPSEADQCLEVAESHGLQLPQQLYTQLRAELKGGPRRSQIARQKVMSSEFIMDVDDDVVEASVSAPAMEQGLVRAEGGAAGTGTFVPVWEHHSEARTQQASASPPRLMESQNVGNMVAPEPVSDANGDDPTPQIVAMMSSELDTYRNILSNVLSNGEPLDPDIVDAIVEDSPMPVTTFQMAQSVLSPPLHNDDGQEEGGEKDLETDNDEEQAVGMQRVHGTEVMDTVDSEVVQLTNRMPESNGDDILELDRDKALGVFALDPEDLDSYQQVATWLDELQAAEAQEVRDLGGEPLTLDWDEGGANPDKAWETAMHILQGLADGADVHIPGLDDMAQEGEGEGEGVEGSQGRERTGAQEPASASEQDNGLQELRAAGIDPDTFDFDAFFHSYEEGEEGGEDEGSEHEQVSPLHTRQEREAISGPTL